MTEKENKALKFGFILNYKRMWQFIKPYWGRALLTLLITIPIGCLDSVIALALKPYMDNSFASGKTGSGSLPSWVIPVAIILFTIIQSALEYASTYLNAWTGNKITIAMKEKLYEKLVHFDSSFFDSSSSGEVVYRFDGDPNTACTGLFNNVKLFISRIVSSVSLIAVLLYTSWQLAIFSIVLLGGALYPLTCIRKMIKEIVHRSVETGGDVLTTYTETFAGAKTIASYNLQSHQITLFQKLQKQLFKLAIKQTQKTAWLTPVMHIIISIALAGVIYIGGYCIAQGEMTPGDFVSFLTALLMLYTPIKNIGKNFNSMQLSFMAVERVFEILEKPILIKDKKNAKEMPPLKKSIEFSKVSFEYVKGKPVLQDIDLTLKKGKTIAFVGNSGGGKSTIVNLLPRFYDATKGKILMDGVDIKNFKLTSLRSQIAVVFQDNFLFSGTIRQNILLGKKEATQYEIDSAVHSACLDDFIDSLPNGLDTEIGERGALLSGGQKQRIAIARAFIKNAPIVILDEATSALDNKSEAIVQRAIDNLMKDRTVFVIAHRLSTVQNADKIIVLNEGKIVEEGTHEALLSKENGAYRALYMAQFKGR